MADYLIHDSTLEDIADAIRSKTGGSSLIAPEDMPSEIESISGGGSSGGLVKKTGTVSIASNYTYTGAVDATYTGMEIATGLSTIYSVVAYSKNWNDRVWSANMYGFSSAINNGIQTGGENSSLYYPTLAVIWNGESRPTYGSTIQGIVLPMAGNGLDSGTFGIKTHAGSYPLRAGDTLIWEAVGEE